MDLGMSPLKIQSLPKSSPPRSRFLVSRIGRGSARPRRQRDFGTLLDHLGCLYALWRRLLLPCSLKDSSKLTVGRPSCGYPLF